MPASATPAATANFLVNLQCLLRRRAKLLCRNTEKIIRVDTMEKWVKTLSFKLQQRGSERSELVNGSSVKENMRKKFKQFYAAALAAATTMTTTTLTFLIDKIVLSLVILPEQYFSSSQSSSLAISLRRHSSSRYQHSSAMTNYKVELFSFYVPLWSDFEALLHSFFYDNTTIWLDFMLS